MGSRFNRLLGSQSTLFFFLIFFQPRGVVAAADLLPPVLSHLFNYSCDDVQCGKGTCKVSSNKTFLGLPGFSCECDTGWTRFLNAGGFEFLPCVIPKCTLDYSCSPGTPVPGSTPSPSPSLPLDFLKLDICSFAFCGEGSCTKTSSLSYHCDCRSGYSNLLNVSNFPCFSNCVLSADCSKLGIGNTDASSSPQPQSSFSDEGPPNFTKGRLLQLVLFSVQMILLSRV